MRKTQFKFSIKLTKGMKLKYINVFLEYYDDEDVVKFISQEDPYLYEGTIEFYPPLATNKIKVSIGGVSADNLEGTFSAWIDGNLRIDKETLKVKGNRFKFYKDEVQL